MDASQKQTALEKQRTIIIATIDYLILQQSGSIVFDDFDPVKLHFEQERTKTEKYFAQRRLDKLEQMLAKLIKGLQHRIDLKFDQYIKNETGYDIDIFEDLRNRANEIILKKEISSQQELNDISLMVHYQQEISEDKKPVEQLFLLISEYRESIGFKGDKNKTTEVITTTEKGEIIEIKTVLSTGPKPKLLEEDESISPDGKRKVTVNRWSDGENASTYVLIIFPTASGVVYGLNGILTGVTAYWEDNHHIVIETKENYEANTKYSQVSSFDDVIKISYINR
ncbi:MAG: hypothetical protein EOO87_09100 [Pedobacter sp.]|nr:MAG: hypothetical protein EOO87_09100 [Pedobacter sp.]